MIRYCDGCGEHGVDRDLQRGGEDFVLCDDCRDGLHDTYSVDGGKTWLPMPAENLT